MTRTIRVAAVQPDLQYGEVEANLARLEELIRDAHRAHDPDVIVVPEAMTSPNVYDKSIRAVPRPVDGAPFVMLHRLSRELGCCVGGGFLAKRGKHAYGTYVLSEPDGRAHLHDKDQPTVWENNYYRGGDDPGVTRLALFDDTPIGLACGWEWARFRTDARLREAEVQLVLGGMCWPSVPRNWRGPAGAIMGREHRFQRQYARELPRQMARLVGAPVAMASHVGQGATFDMPMMPGVRYTTPCLGETQICERDGTILARLSQEQGEGHIAADVQLAAPAPLDPIEPRLWIPVMTSAVWLLWHATNTHGKLRYWETYLRGRFPWQDVPGGDLPDEVPAGTAATAPAATTA